MVTPTAPLAEQAAPKDVGSTLAAEEEPGKAEDLAGQSGSGRRVKKRARRI